MDSFWAASLARGRRRRRRRALRLRLRLHAADAATRAAHFAVLAGRVPSGGPARPVQALRRRLHRRRMRLVLGVRWQRRRRLRHGRRAAGGGVAAGLGSDAGHRLGRSRRTRSHRVLHRADPRLDCWGWPGCRPSLGVPRLGLQPSGFAAIHNLLLSRICVHW